MDSRPLKIEFRLKKKNLYIYINPQISRAFLDFYTRNCCAIQENESEINGISCVIVLSKSLWNLYHERFQHEPFSYDVKLFSVTILKLTTASGEEKTFLSFLTKNQVVAFAAYA